MDNIAALIGQTQRPDEVRLAEALRGQQRQGDFLGMSTLQPIAQMGQAMSTRSADAAKTMGGLVQARKEMEARKAENEARLAAAAKQQEDLAQYRADTLAAQEAYRAAREERYRLDRESDKLIAEMNNKRALEVADRRIAAITGKAQKPAAGQVKDYLAGQATVKRVGALVDLYASMTEDQKDILNNPKGEVALEYMPDNIGTLAKGAVYPDEKVKEFMTKGRALESQISKSMSGLALTGYEIKDRKSWSPFAAGLTTEDKIIRMRNVVEDARDRMSEMRDVYGNFLPDYSAYNAFKAIDPVPDVNNGEAPEVTFNADEFNALEKKYAGLTDEEIDQLIQQETLRQQQLLYADEYGGM